MALTLYYHPFSSYSWKALIPLYEAGTLFTARSIEDQQAAAEWKQHWPIGRFPVLVEEFERTDAAGGEHHRRVSGQPPSGAAAAVAG